jgi:hypothetical protein
MSDPLSVVKDVIQDVTLDLVSFVTTGATATITIHCGPDDVSYETILKRRHPPKRIVRDK